MFCTEIYFQSPQFVLTRLHSGDNGNDDDDERIAPRILAPLTVSIWNNVYIMDVIHAEHPTSQLPTRTYQCFCNQYSRGSALSKWGWIWSLELILTDLDSIFSELALPLFSKTYSTMLDSSSFKMEVALLEHANKIGEIWVCVWLV